MLKKLRAKVHRLWWCTRYALYMGKCLGCKYHDFTFGWYNATVDYDHLKGGSGCPYFAVTEQMSTWY